MKHEKTTLAPRIYVASLADYNAGILHGRWIKGDQDEESVQAAIAAMLAESTEPVAEDWAIHDYEGFGGINLSESESIASVCEVAPLLVEHGEIFGGLVEHFGGLPNLDEAKRCMEDGFQGTFRTLEEYAEQFVEDCYSDAIKNLPDFIRYHIDYAGIAHDFEIGGDIFTTESGGEVHVFSSSF